VKAIGIMSIIFAVLEVVGLLFAIIGNDETDAVATTVTVTDLFGNSMHWRG